MMGKHDWEDPCDHRMIDSLFVIWILWTQIIMIAITIQIVIYVRTVIHDRFISSVKLIVFKFAAKNGLAELITLPEECLFLEEVDIVIFI